MAVEIEGLKMVKKEGLVEVKKEETRVRVNYSISAKGLFQPDVTSEAETVETAIANLQKAHDELRAFAVKNGYAAGETPF